MKYIILISILLGSVLLVNNFREVNEPKVSQGQISEVNVQGNETSDYAPQTKQMGAVEVKVMPISFSGNETIFRIFLNTHSIELSFDFTKIAKLTDDKGHSYKVLEWRGGSGGHHLEGSLSFEKVKSDATEVLLTIDGVDNQKADFSWKLKGGEDI